MKLVLFNEYRLGVLRGDQVVDVHRALPKQEYHHPQEIMDSVITQWAQLRGALEDAANKGKGTPASQVRFRAPMPKPAKMVCAVRNYLEFGQIPPADLDAFIKSSNAVIGNGDTVVLPPEKASVFHHEAELAFVVGKRATRTKPADWQQYVFGYLQFMDVSARGFMPNSRNSFYWGKSWDTFAPMGPALVTADEVKDPHNLQVRLWVDGELRQDYPTSDMAHKIPNFLEFATSICTLDPGDVVALGTNHQGLGPLQDGDSVRQEITGFGPPLTCRVSDPLKRTWPKGVDKAFAQQVIASAQRR